MPALLAGRLPLPVIAAPLFIISNRDLLIVGSFPALNAWPAGLLDEWLARMREELAQAPYQPDVAPFAVNQILHSTNARLEHRSGALRQVS